MNFAYLGGLLRALSVDDDQGVLISGQGAIVVISAEDCIVETLSAVGSSGTQKSASHGSIVIVDKSYGSAG